MSSLINRIFGSQKPIIQSQNSTPISNISNISNLSNHEDNDPIYISDDDLESNSNSDDISYLGKLVHRGNPSIYVANGREFSNNTKNWAFNREMNEEHILKLKHDLEKDKSPNFVGTFKLAIDSQNRIRLMDGQHRHEVLRRIMSSNSKFNIELILEVYNVTDVFNGMDTFMLFDKCNTVLSIKDKDTPKKSYAFVVYNLMNEFPTCIKPKNPSTGRDPNFPNLSDTRLYNELIGSNIIEKFNISENELLILITRKNNSLSTLSFDELFPNIDNVNEKETSRLKSGHLKCNKSGFYLGLQSKKNKKLQWITDIYRELIIGLKMININIEEYNYKS